jgi:hypothetical protein
MNKKYLLLWEAPFTVTPAVIDESTTDETIGQMSVETSKLFVGNLVIFTGDS